MKLLMIGGTRFVGWQIVAAAQARGHEVTVFHRGKTAAPEGVEAIVGDRDGELDRLGDRRWDAVVDTCGYVPRLVRDAVEALRDRVEHFTFISTVSVYADFSPRPVDENAALATLEDPSTEKVTGETYGGLKVLCEEEVLSGMPGRALIPRPGLIVGPRDYTDRVTHWPARLSLGGEVAAPGTGEEPVQFIDGRDLAEFTVAMVEARETGIYNCTGPDYTLSMREFLHRSAAVVGARRAVPDIRWISAEVVEKEELGGKFPLWTEAGHRGVF